jgi:hypothetical protein
MGLVVHSLELLSPQAKREYYLYVLDYGWDEPFSEVIRKNFYKISDLACKTEAAFVIGSDGNMGHFDDEVLSWHSINGQDASELLPAILITRTNPHEFKNCTRGTRKENDDRFKFILIPLRKLCQKSTDVMPLITSIFRDIQNKKDLKDFVVQKELKPGIENALVNSLILEPNFHGIGFSFKRFKEFLG